MDRRILNQQLYTAWWRARFLALAGSVSAATYVLGAPTPSYPAPVFPQKFDLPTVQRLIAGVDEGSNEQTLKYGFFLNPGIGGVDRGQALETLASAVSHETTGSLRWFYLQDVFAFGAVHTSPVYYERAYAAYDQIFHQEPAAARAGALRPWQEAVADYVFAVRGQYGPQHTNKYASEKQTLIDALKGYLLFARSSATSLFDPPWTSAVLATGGYDDFAAVVDEAMAQKPPVSTYSFLRTAADIYAPYHPEKAALLLQAARSVLPRDDPKRVEGFFDDLAGVLVKAHNPVAAAEAQEASYRLTGRGLAALATLYWRSKNLMAFDRIVMSLQVPGANESDINALAFDLARVYQEDKAANGGARDRAVRLLSGYLLRPSKRDTAQELQARLTLGRLFIEDKKYVRARKMLQEASAIAVAAGPPAQLYAAEITQELRRLGSRVESGLPGNGGGKQP